MARAGKKGGVTALQTEVKTDGEWAELLGRKGLVLVDVYSDWSGPCAAMVSMLRKVKMEIGGDSIGYAIARNDEIEQLERFRGTSEPVWMFIEDGNMVNLMFGAHCPNLQKTLVDEIKRVQQSEPAKRTLLPTERAPEEEGRWQEEQALRRAEQEKKLAKEEAVRKQKYEHYLMHMMIVLSEETALVMYPWVFTDDNGNPRSKSQSPPYTELVHDLFKMRFDVLEEARIALDEETIEKMFVESNVELTEETIAGLTDGKCMAMRLRGKPPHPDWPVPYPFQCADETEKCPVRAIDDVENYLLCVIHGTPPTASGAGAQSKESLEGVYYDRHMHVHEQDPEVEGDFARVDPAVWAPPQARSKVHVYKTLFASYLETKDPYEEPLPPAPLCVLQFRADKFDALRDACNGYPDAVVHFAAFDSHQLDYAKRLASSPDDFQRKVRVKSGNEVFVVVLRKLSDEVFLTFATIEPYRVTEDEDETLAVIDRYFHAGVVDYVAVREVSEHEYEYEYEYEYEHAGEGEYEEDEGASYPPYEYTF